MSDTRGARILRRTVVGFTLAGALALLLWVSSAPWGATFVGLVGAAVATLGALEARRMGALPDARAVCGAVAAAWATGVLVVGAGGNTRLGLDGLSEAARYGWTLGGALGVCALVGLVAALPAGERHGRRVLTTLWLAAPLPLLALVRRELDAEGLAALLILAKVGDVAGYYGGQLLAGPNATHPFPRLSPGKTTIGCACSLVAGTGVGALFTGIGWLPAGALGLASGALAGAAVNVAAQAGDLLESAAKRAGKVKDSGTWFGPSGGVLDLVDSLLLAVPVAALVWPLLLDLP